LDIVKVGVIGAGAIATKAHIPCFKNNKFVQVEAVVDTDEKRARFVAKKFRIGNHFASLSELVDSKVRVDAISICTPPRFHAGIAIEALDAGINVLCEKPLAESVDSGNKIREAVRSSHAIFMMGFNRRFNANYQHTKHMALSDALGRIYAVQYESLQENPLVGWSKSDWFYSEIEGGCLRDQGPHVFDMLNWFLGKPLSVVANQFTNLHTKIDESAFATVKYESGAIGIGMMSWLSPPRVEKLEVLGTGRTVIASPELVLELSGGGLPEIELFKASSPMFLSRFRGMFGMSKSSNYQLEIDHFVNCIKKGLKPSVTVQDGFTALALNEAAARSIQENRAILL
jgi:predicted dehydrogenase